MTMPISIAKCTFLIVYHLVYPLRYHKHFDIWVHHFSLEMFSKRIKNTSCLPIWVCDVPHLLFLPWQCLRLSLFTVQYSIMYINSNSKCHFFEKSQYTWQRDMLVHCELYIDTLSCHVWESGERLPAFSWSSISGRHEYTALLNFRGY